MWYSMDGQSRSWDCARRISSASSVEFVTGQRDRSSSVCRKFVRLAAVGSSVCVELRQVVARIVMSLWATNR